jgi:peptide/nickel transport system substrate-binding protein
LKEDIMKKKAYSVLALLMALLLVVAACGTDATVDTPEGPGTTSPPAPPPGGAAPRPQGPGGELVEVESGGSPMHPALVAALADYPAFTTNTNAVLPRGTGGDNVLRVAIPSNSVILGLFLRTHAQEAFDSAIAALTESVFVSIDAGNVLTSNGIVSFEYDRGRNVVILNMQENVFWHDGVPLTLDDLVFAYEVIAHPDYTSVRYDASSFIPNVQGIEEYRSGESDSISGLRLSNNNRTLHIHYVDPLPPSALFAGGVWLNPSPRHWLTPAIAEVGHEGLEGHIRARDQILGYGAFKIETVIPGESVYLVPNDNYWRGAPLVDGILIQIIPLDMANAAMSAGEYDIAAFGTDQLAEYNLTQPDNFQLLGWPSNSGGYFNFRMGHFVTDADGERAMQLREDDHPIMNIAIRQAIAHSLDRQLIADTVGFGLGVPAPSVLHPFNAGPYINLDLGGYVYDLDLASRILDEAGFTARDAEGMRLDLNGERMTIIYGAHNNATNQVLVPVTIQNLRSIGLRAELYGGDFVEWGMFLDIVAYSDEIGPIDIFMMGWSFGMNPAPHGLWSETAIFNMPRYTSPTFKRILDDIISDDAWDPEFLADAYRRWEDAFHAELPAVPWLWSLNLLAANNRVTGVNRVRMDNGLNEPGNWTVNTYGTHLIGLTARAPYVASR